MQVIEFCTYFLFFTFYMDLNKEVQNSFCQGIINCKKKKIQETMLLKLNFKGDVVLQKNTFTASL